MAGEPSIENDFPVRAEGSDEDVLDVLVVLVAGIELAAALGLAEMNPVRSELATALDAQGLAGQRGYGSVVTDFPLSGAIVKDSVSGSPHAVAWRPTRVSRQDAAVVPCATGDGPRPLAIG